MKRGNQRPTFERVGQYAYSLSEDVAEMFAEDGGATFYPSQLYELELMLARDEDGAPAASTIGISKPRQNGKSYAARFYAVYMAVFEHREVLYSAHHSSTTKKMFMALCDLFESPERFPDFANDVKSVSHARGYEGFYFKSWRDKNGNIRKGGCIEFATRTNSGARGGTFSVIVIDEAQDLVRDYYLDIIDLILKRGIERGHWTMFGDFTKQAIYSGNLSGQEMIDMIEDRTSFIRFKLTVNCRNTKQICDEIETVTGFKTSDDIWNKVEGIPVAQEHIGLLCNGAHHLRGVGAACNHLSHLSREPLKGRKLKEQQALLFGEGQEHVPYQYIPEFSEHVLAHGADRTARVLQKPVGHVVQHHRPAPCSFPEKRDV